MKTKVALFATTHPAPAGRFYPAVKSTAGGLFPYVWYGAAYTDEHEAYRIAQQELDKATEWLNKYTATWGCEKARG